MMIALTTLYQDRNKKLLPDVINQYLACYLVVCLLITACTSIDTMVPYINKWVSFRENEPSLYIYIKVIKIIHV